VKRRAVLATVATAATAGCTVSAADDPDPSAIEVTGLGESSVYQDYEFSETLMGGMFYDGEYRLDLIYHGSADYDPGDHDVYLMDGYSVVDQGSDGDDTLSADNRSIMFHIERGDIEDGARYRVVSKYPAGVVDDFEITIHTEGDTE